MQMLKKICKKPDTSISFSYENTVTEGASLSPVKSVHRDEPVFSLAQIDELCHALKLFLLKNHSHWVFCCPKYACINLSDV